MAPNGNIYVVWGGGPLACASNVYFSRSTDTGLSFSQPANLSGLNCESVDLAYNAAIAVDTGGVVFVVWDQTQEGSYPYNEVYFSRSIDAGQTFSELKNISHSPQTWFGGIGAVVPAVAAGPPGHVYVAWVDVYDREQSEQVFFSRSTDGGGSFSAPRQLSFRTAEVSTVSRPHLAVDATRNRVYVGWGQGTVADGNADTFLTVSLDGGQTFSPAVSLSNSPGWSSSPLLAADPAGVLYLCWVEDYETWFRRSLDGGVTFSEPKRLSRQGHGASWLQGLATGPPGHVYVVWTEYATGGDIFLRRSSDSGQTFRRAVNASGRKGLEQGDVAADGAGHVYVMFTGGSPQPGAWWYSVYLRRSRALL